MIERDITAEAENIYRALSQHVGQLEDVCTTTRRETSAEIKDNLVQRRGALDATLSHSKQGNRMRNPLKVPLQLSLPSPLPRLRNLVLDRIGSTEYIFFFKQEERKTGMWRN